MCYYTNRRKFFFLSNLQTIFIRSCAYHLFEYSAQMMWILETNFVSNFTDSLVLFCSLLMALYSFFDEYDFTGKTLIPFCTHGGSRFSQAEKTIATLDKGAKTQKGLAISRNDVNDSGESVSK